MGKADFRRAVLGRTAEAAVHGHQIGGLREKSGPPSLSGVEILTSQNCGFLGAERFGITHTGGSSSE